MVGLIMDGVGWEAVVKASLLVALLLLIGFSHQSSKKQAQQNSLVRLSDPRPAGGGLARAVSVECMNWLMCRHQQDAQSF
jgi:hypothetical protein